MNKIEINYFEVMVNRKCNLRCVGCTSFCDYPQVKEFEWNKVKSDLEKWSEILSVKNIGLIGGEPLLNTHFYDWLYGVRRIFFDSYILVVTNGLMLKKWPDLISRMIEVSPCKLMITLHVNDEEITKSLDIMLKEKHMRFLIREHKNQYIIKEYVLFDSKRNFSIQIVKPDYFIKMYKGYGKNIFAYESKNAEDAYNICIDCPMLYEGKLYRCSRLALIREQLKLTGQLFDEELSKSWKSCLDYQGVDYSSDIEEIRNRLSLFNKAEEVCKSCPCSSDNYKIKNTQNVLLASEMIDNTRIL